MKKVEMLRSIEEKLGKKFVLPYIVCRDFNEIKKAVKHFDSEGKTWAMRTDTPEGKEQAFHSPFILNGTLEEAKKNLQRNQTTITLHPI